MAFIDVITGIGGLTHYYPLNKAYGGDDAWGGTSAAPTSHTNYIDSDFIGSGVTFPGTGPDGAVFNGSLTTGYLSIPHHPDFCIKHPSGTANQLTLMCFVTITDWHGATPILDTEKVHWAGKGNHNDGTGTLEWAFRHYVDGGTGQAAVRQGRVSCYYFPHDAGHGSVAAQGNGAYVDTGNPERTSEWVFFITMDCTTMPSSFNGPSSANYISCWDGNTVSNTQAINKSDSGNTSWNGPDAVYTGKVTLGKRLDNNSGPFRGIIRRFAVFNKALSQTDITTIYNARAQAEGSLAVDPGQPGPGGTFVPVAKVGADSGAGLSADANTLTIAAPTLGANDLHVIAATSNATAPEFTTPTGYTSVSGTSSTDHTHGGTSNASTALFYRKGPAAANATLAVVPAGGIGKSAIAHMVIPDVDNTTTPSFSFATGSNATGIVAPSVSGVTGQNLVTVHGIRDDTVNATLTIAPPTGLAEVTERDSHSVTQANVAVEIAYVKLATTAATGTKSATSSSAGDWAAYSALVTPISIAKIATLTDPFTSFNAAKWARSDAALVGASSGAMQITPSTATPTVTGVTTFDLDSSAIYAKFLNAPATNSMSAQFLLQNANDPTLDLGFRINTAADGSRTLVMGSRTSAVFDGTPTTIAYDPVSMAYFRISETGTTVTFSTSPDNPSNGGTWTTRATITSPAWITTVRPYWTSARGVGLADGTTKTAISELNIAAPAAPIPDPTVSPVGQFNDDFAAPAATKWVYTGSAATGGQLRVSVPGNATSVDNWNLQTSLFDVVPSPAGGGTTPLTRITAESSATAGTGFRVQIDGAGNATAGLIVANTFTGSTVTFAVPVNGKVRIREGAIEGGSAGQIYVDTGVWSDVAQAYVWTNRNPSTTFTSPAWVTSIKVILSALNSGGTSSAAIFDNFNTNVAPLPNTPPISDSFDGASIDSAKWIAYGTPTQSGGVLTLDAVEGIVSVGTVDLTNNKQYVQVVSTTSAPGTYSVFRLERDATNHVQWRFDSGNIYAEKVVGGTVTALGNIAFSPSATAYVQIREQGGTIYFEYSSSPSTMTTLATTANPFPINALKLRLERSV